MPWRALVLGVSIAITVVTAESPSLSAQTAEGIWISRADLLSRPMSGPSWNRLVTEVGKTCLSPNLSNQDDTTNVCVMAKALYAARTGDSAQRDAVVAALTVVADGPRYSGRALALGRELAAYVIAADLIDLRSFDVALDERFRARLRILLTTPTTSGPPNLVACHEQRPNNWGTHCGASRIAVAAYLEDQDELDRAATVFKGWLGDREAYAGFKFDDLHWQCDEARPVPLNPVGCFKLGRSVDGVLPDDQQRSGAFTWPPPQENYTYEALQGALAQAIMLSRTGRQPFEWESRALLRAFEWLHDEANFPAEGEDIWEAHVINHFYGTRFPAAVPARPGKNVGWTDWTHPPTTPADALPVPPTAPSTPTPTPVPEPEPTPPPAEPDAAPAPVPAAPPAPPPAPAPASPVVVPNGQVKAMTFEDGAALHAESGADFVAGSVTILTDTALKGNASARFTTASAYVEERLAASAELYLSFYVRLGALPKKDVRIALISSDGRSLGNLILRPSGRLRLRNNSSTIGSESQPLAVGTLYRVGLHQRAGTGSNASLEAYLAGGDDLFTTPFASTATGTWTLPADRVRIGSTTSAAVNAVVDDVVINLVDPPGPSN